ncbi:MAG: hypothetical protein AB1473_01985 [Thermodesulfobacteriota bacterium]
MDTINNVGDVNARPQTPSGASIEDTQSVARGQAASESKASRRVLTRSRWKARQFLRRNKIFFETLVPAAILIFTLLVLMTQTLIFRQQFKLLEIQTTIQAKQISNIPVLGLSFKELTLWDTLEFELTNRGGSFEVADFDAKVSCIGLCEISPSVLSVEVPLTNCRPTWRREEPAKPGKSGTAILHVGSDWRAIGNDYLRVVKRAGGKGTLRLFMSMRFEGRDAAGTRHTWYFIHNWDLSEPGGSADTSKARECDEEEWKWHAWRHEQSTLAGWVVPIDEIRAIDLLAWLRPGWFGYGYGDWGGYDDSDYNDYLDGSDPFKGVEPPF